MGWGDHVRQCDVMEAARSLAQDYWHARFHAVEQAEEAEKRARITERKKSEPVYRMAPDLGPELIDEGLGYGAMFRLNAGSDRDNFSI
jgi:hypothetical protein